MRNGKGLNALACGLALGLAAWAGTASAVRADEGEGEAKKVEMKRVVIVKDGKPQVWESGGPVANRGYLGVGLLDLTPELRTHFGVPEESGVMVSKVEPGSPAEKAGIKVGDILTLIDGKAMKSTWDVMGKVRTYDNSQQVPVEIWRNGKAQTVSAPIVTRERPELDMAPLFTKVAGPQGDHMLLQLDGESLPKLKDLPNGKWLDEDGHRIQIKRLGSGREADLEKKLKELEKRIDDLQRQLEKKK
ncbi:MAG TPA: PDZ domain-containing protein [Thermoanaerobaculia bacterium]|jgi:membrane-associated protease RseP (regulator of RpoE activity)|nr:PDZ domain-containing protein [Thermoanaerobaculia bacterium]